MVPEPISTKPAGDDALSLIFGALAHPARRGILSKLAEGDASVAELARPFNVSMRAISKHIGVLERAGLVTREKDAQRRPSRLRTQALRDAHEWLESYRRLWEKRFDRIDAVLENAQKREGIGADRRRNSRR